LVFFLIQGLGWLPFDVGLFSGPESILPCAVGVAHQMVLDAVHDLGELELEADLEKRLVLANGVGNPRLHSVPHVGLRLVGDLNFDDSVLVSLDGLEESGQRVRTDTVGLEVE